MIKIAHRGNINGPVPEKENSPDYIMVALDKGYDCELDLWCLEKKFFLGHDGPQYKISLSFLIQFHNVLWVHCKNLDALLELKDTFNCFFHDKDTYTLTSRGFIWGNIGSPTTDNVICVMPPGDEIGNCLGVCTDNPTKFIKSAM